MMPRIGASVSTRVAGPRDRFVVMGRDAHPERHLFPIRENLGSRLVVHGPEPQPEVWLPGADATLLPTLYDAAANTTLEALAAGVPAVTSGRDGNSEVVPDPGLVVDDPGDVAGFARALRWAWEEGQELSRRCRLASEDWPVSRNGRAVEELYLEWLDERA